MTEDIRTLWKELPGFLQCLFSWCSLPLQFFWILGARGCIAISWPRELLVYLMVFWCFSTLETLQALCFPSWSLTTLVDVGASWLASLFRDACYFYWPCWAALEHRLFMLSCPDSKVTILKPLRQKEGWEKVESFGVYSIGLVCSGLMIHTFISWSIILSFYWWIFARFWQCPSLRMVRNGHKCHHGRFWVTEAVACGTLSSACRCFAWESAQMWTLEVFPTQIRATAFSVAMTVMRLASILSLKVSAQYIGILDAANSLRILAALLLASGLFSTLLLPKETANVPMTEADADVKAFWMFLRLRQRDLEGLDWIWKELVNWLWELLLGNIVFAEFWIWLWQSLNRCKYTESGAGLGAVRTSQSTRFVVKLSSWHGICCSSKCHNLHFALRRSKSVASLVTDQAGIDGNLFQRASALVGRMWELSVSALRSSDSAFDEDEEEDDWSDCDEW